MPAIDLTDDGLAAVAAAVRRTIEDDKFPPAPRLDPLRAALARRTWYRRQAEKRALSGPMEAARDRRKGK